MSYGGKDRETMVVMDGLDPTWKFDDLSNRLTTAANDCVNDSSSQKPIIWLPLEEDESGDSILRGFAYLYFSQIEEAEKFAKRWKTHTALRSYVRKSVAAYTWQQVSRYMTTAEEFPGFSKSAFSEQRNLYWWLPDSEGHDGFREQYAVRYLSPKFQETMVNWFDERIPKASAVPSYDGQREHANGLTMTVSFVKWSNRGGYLASFAKGGVQLWGGPQWKELDRKSHPLVNYVDFSPNDSCLITCNTPPPEDDSIVVGPMSGSATGRGSSSGASKAEPKLIVWDLTQKRENAYREFGMKDIGLALTLKLGTWWPLLKWGANDAFFAFRSTSSKSTRFDKMKSKDLNQISVYDADNFLKLGKKSVSVPDLYDFGFSPTQPLLAYTTRARGVVTASLTIMSLPTKTIVKTQSLGFATVAAIYWQSQGDYIAVKIWSKDGSSRIGVMALKEDGMPWALSDDLPRLDFFSWEPDHNRFAILQFDDKRYKDLPSASFFSVDKKGRCKLLTKMWTIGSDRIKANAIHWAPHGGRAVVSFIERSQTGQLIFVDLGTGKAVKKSHEDANYIEWDPSGRYLVTASCQPIDSKAAGDETGFTIWSFQGEVLFRRQISRFYQFLWRPRPPLDFLKLTAPSISDLRPKMVEYSKGFESSDVDVKRMHQSKHIQVNLAKLKKWKLKEAQLKARTAEIRAKLIAKYGAERIHKGEEQFEVTEVIQEVQHSYEDAVIDEAVASRVLSGEMVTIGSLHKMQRRQAASGPPPQ